MRKNKGIGFAITCFLLSVLALVILLPMVQTFLYSFSSITDMKQYMQTRNNYDQTVWMESRLSPRLFSLSQYYHILITDNTVLRLFCNSVMYALLILLGLFTVLARFDLAAFRPRAPKELLGICLGAAAIVLLLQGVRHLSGEDVDGSRLFSAVIFACWGIALYRYYNDRQYLFRQADE